MTPEQAAERDLAATGQTEPPFRPSKILRDLYGVRTVIANVRAGTTQVVLIPGSDPRCVVSPIIGTALARVRVGHEAGHAGMGHLIPTALFQPPVGFRGHTLPKNKEAEAQEYGLAVTMPRFALEDALADGSRSLQQLEALFDVPESDLRRRLQATGLWRLVYDDRNHTAYIRSGWWKLTRRPKFLAELAERQGRPAPQCERPKCKRNATHVNHKNYETKGRESDEDLEGLCNQCHYEEHVSVGRIA